MARGPKGLTVLFGVAILWLSPALAEEDPDTENAHWHFTQGVEAYAANNYPKALREFREARGRRPDLPELTFNIARSLDRLEQDELALTEYEAYLKMIAPRGEPEAATRVEVLRKRVRKDRPPPILTSPPPLPERPVEAARPLRHKVPLAVGGIALALAIVGTGLVGSVPADLDTLRAQWQAQGPTQAGVDQATALGNRATAGYVFFGAAGAVAVVDVVLWIVAANRGRR